MASAIAATAGPAMTRLQQYDAMDTPIRKSGDPYFVPSKKRVLLGKCESLQWLMARAPTSMIHYKYNIQLVSGVFDLDGSQRVGHTICRVCWTRRAGSSPIVKRTKA